MEKKILKSAIFLTFIVAGYTILTIFFNFMPNKPSISVNMTRETSVKPRTANVTNYKTSVISKTVLSKLRKTLSSFRKMPPEKMKNYTKPQMDLNKSVTYHRPNGTIITPDDIISETRDEDYPVPNIIHYIIILLHDQKLQFHQLVCFLSGFHIAKPKRVIFWYSNEPHDEYWEYLKKNITRPVWDEMVIMARRDPPQQIYGLPVNVIEHKADVMRLEALISFGGIYLDTDVIVLKSLVRLRKFAMTIGRETSHGLCNGILLSSKDNFFLKLWHLSYQYFKDSEWALHSVLLPHHLNLAFPGNCHVEKDSLNRPNWTRKELPLIYGTERTWNWKKKNYAMHLWYSNHGVQYNMESIKEVNSTLGDMFRFVLFGRTKPV